MPLTEEQRNRHTLSFLLLDTNSDGFIKTSELGCLLRTVGLYPTNAEVAAMFPIVDPDESGLVSLERALDAIDALSGQKTTEEELREAFKVLDEDADGYLTTAQLRHILVNLGIQLRQEEADEVIEDAEKDAEGQINIDDIITMLMSEVVLKPSQTKPPTQVGSDTASSKSA